VGSNPAVIFEESLVIPAGVARAADGPSGPIQNRTTAGFRTGPAAAHAGPAVGAAERALGYNNGMQIQLTAVFRRIPQGYVAFVEELPGANTQGATLEEARANLEEAVTLVLEANRLLAQEEIGESPVLREPLRISA